MKRVLLISLIVIAIIPGSIYATGNLINVEYEIINADDHKIVKLNIEIKDSSSSVRQLMNPQSSADIPSFHDFEGLDIESLNSDIISQIKENDELDFYVERPDYINDIIQLISTESEKEKAIKIYNEKNYTINNSTNQSVSVIQGKIVKKVTIEITIPITVKSNTNLTLYQLEVKYNDTIYKIDNLDIKIEKGDR